MLKWNIVPKKTTCAQAPYPKEGVRSMSMKFGELSEKVRKAAAEVLLAHKTLPISQLFTLTEKKMGRELHYSFFQGAILSGDHVDIIKIGKEKALCCAPGMITRDHILAEQISEVREFHARNNQPPAWKRKLKKSHLGRRARFI